ncbi:BMA-LIN-40, isoform a [Aphelenchoides besseyi]|nr:BMA-LIN-40, isoform a [Aphelenchoides besseyi]
MAESAVKKEPSSQSVQMATMAQNMYRVGDYVYFENFPSSPYNIRRIEELNKTASGTVEAKVVCFFRRRDLPAALLKIADKAERQSEILYRPRRSLLTRKNVTGTNGVTSPEDNENGNAENNEEGAEGKSKDGDLKEIGGLAGLPLQVNRSVDTLPATQIRGKCTVVMLSEVETSESYLNREDAFFYSLVFDAVNHTLLADKGKIDIGERHQAHVPEILPQLVIDRQRGKSGEVMDEEKDDSDDAGDLQIADQDDEQEKEMEEKETKPSTRTRHSSREHDGIYETSFESIVYHPHHSLTDRDIDQFLIIARAVGTFSRALDTSSTMKLPSLHMTAAAASRDVALFHAMALLHQAKYDIGQAVKYLVPPPSKQHYPLDADKATGHNTVSLGGPILCRDQLEEWSAAEATLFEEAIEKCGKDFHDIRAECLPWKSIRDIVEYYYMWKTTARHAEMQRSKLAEQDNKLKQVYIPNYNKPHPNLVGPPNNTNEPIKSNSSCESCHSDESTAWYGWGPAHLQLRLCNDCWAKAYDLDGAADMSAGRGQNSRGNTQRAINGTPSKLLSSQNIHQSKDRGAFFYHSYYPNRIARGIAPRNILNIRKSARSPWKPIDRSAVFNYYLSRDLNDILRNARQIKARQKGTLSQGMIDMLTNLHKQLHIN